MLNAIMPGDERRSSCQPYITIGRDQPSARKSRASLRDEKSQCEYSNDEKSFMHRRFPPFRQSFWGIRKKRDDPGITKPFVRFGQTDAEDITCISLYLQ